MNIPAVWDEAWDGYVITFTGAAIRPLEPDAAQIRIGDIAHGLANSCRFTGQTRSFYSVAQHSVLASWIVAPELALTALLHDASEAYLSDIARPVKSQDGFRQVYKVAEAQLMQAIASVFGFAWPPPPEIHEADDILLRTEQRDLMPALLRLPGDGYLPFPIEPSLPDEAETSFLNRYHELTGETE